VRQQDSAWQAQTGAPIYPQAGNVPGGKRDVLRSADFNNGQLQALASDSGSWQVQGGSLQVASTSNKSDAVAVFQVGDALPSYYEVAATIKVIKPTAGWDANSYIVFDYQDKTRFKFAGVDVANNKLVIGQRTEAGWQVLQQVSVPGSVKSDTWYGVMLYVNGLTVTVALDNKTFLSQVFAPTVVDGFSYGLNWGLVGFGSNKSRGAMDNIAVQVVPPTATVTHREEFSSGAGAMFDSPALGSWQAAAGRLVGTPLAPADTAIDLADLGGATQLAHTSLLEISATLRTSARAGIVFDRYGDTDFKFAAIDVATRQVLIGHRSAAGWFIDASVAQNTLGAGIDYTLGVSLRGSTVSVTLNGQAAAGFVFNAVGVDGRFGVFARGAAASFDSVAVKTNDPAAPAALEAAPAAVQTPSSGPALRAPSADELAALAAEAAARWRAAEDASHTAALDRLTVDVADLPGHQLATYADGRILVDIDAAGIGWYIDATPADGMDLSAAAGHVDLLSVLAHEMGHAMGLGHDEDGGGVMAGQLEAGVRLLPQAFSPSASASIASSALPASATPWPIDWRSDAGAVVALPAGVVPLAGEAAKAGLQDWRQRFVNHLGRDHDKLAPNAALRVFAPASASAQVSAKTSASVRIASL
jgi:hypothetical protein